jgi:hypothetical protein
VRLTSAGLTRRLTCATGSRPRQQRRMSDPDDLD